MFFSLFYRGIQLTCHCMICHNYLFLTQLMDIWIIANFCLSWIILLETFIYKFLCGHTFSFLLSRYLGVKFLRHIITLCLTFWGTVWQIVFQKGCTILHSHQQWMRFRIPPHPCQLCLKFFPSWSSHHGTMERNLTRNREVAALIPGLAQWVKDPALPGAVV